MPGASPSVGARRVSVDGLGVVGGKGRAREGEGEEGDENKRRRLASPRVDDEHTFVRGHVPILRGAAGP